jgi:hypothetical protein
MDEARVLAMAFGGVVTGTSVLVSRFAEKEEKTITLL